MKQQLEQVLADIGPANPGNVTIDPGKPMRVARQTIGIVQGLADQVAELSARVEELEEHASAALTAAAPAPAPSRTTAERIRPETKGGRVRK